MLLPPLEKEEVQGKARHPGAWTSAAAVRIKDGAEIIVIGSERVSQWVEKTHY